MASNRGNSSGSNSNMPSGVTRGDYVDPNTLKMINASNAKYEQKIKELFGTIEGFEESVKKATNLEMKRAENEKKNTDKWNKALNAVANKFGIASEEFQLTLNESIKETKKMKEDYAKSLKDWKKDAIKQSFKNETESKKIKYLNNKFSKGNNLASVSNSYWADLEKLKSDALDTYADGLDNKEYKKALMNLNDKYTTDMKEAWKQDFKENHKVLGGVADGIKDTFNKNKEALQGVLGPLNLIIAPMKEFFGGFGLIFKGIKGGVKWLFGKFTKKNPTANDVLKSGASGVGALYIGNKLDKMFGGTKGEGIGGIFDKFKNLGGTLSTLNGVVKSLSGVATIAGLALVVKDAISGWNKADEWGTENWASMLGAIIGGTGSGGSGAVKGAIKYALLGAPFGPIGILIGGILGGVLGYFGGEFWAQGIQDVKDWFSGDKNKQNEIMKRNLLADVEKKYKKGDISKDYYDAMMNLSSTLNAEDFSKLGSKGTLQDFSNLLLSGKLDNLSSVQLNELVSRKFGVNLSNDPNSLIALKQALSWTNSNISSEYLKDIYKNPQMFGDYMSNLKDIVVLKSGYDRGIDTKEQLVSDLKASGYSEDVIQYILNNSDLSNIPLSNIIYSHNKKNKSRTLYNPYAWGKEYERVDDAIIKTDGSIIKTNPKDTLVALKDIPLSVNQIRDETNKNLNGSLSQMEKDGSLEKKLTTIIDVLSKILAKDVQVQLPPQTRNDLDLLMQGALV